MYFSCIDWHPTSGNRFDQVLVYYQLSIDLLTSIPTGKAKSKAMAKHFNATYCNVDGCNMLFVFGQLVATCWDMLGVFDSDLKMVKFFT